MHPSLSPLSISSLAARFKRSPVPSGAEGGPRPQLVAGVLSGTSGDGIDVVLARPEFGASADGSPILAGLESVAFATEPFEEGVAQRVRAVLDGEAMGLGDLAALDAALGLAFGGAARRVADRHDVGELALVASHGQTVFHHDGDPARGRITMQIGDGDFVAEAAGVAVVSDFRMRDCAAGGHGAPLVGLVDDILFGGAPRPLAILNLGGMSNWTVLLGSEQPPLAFDAGPAGALLDGLSRRLLQAPCDMGGEVALSGRVRPARVTEWLQHPFLQATGPRSTGRDTFGESYVDETLASMVTSSEGSHGAEDVLATACAFVAQAAAVALRGSLSGVERLPGLHVAAAGGGIHNAALMGELQRCLRAELGDLGVELLSMGSSEAHGVPPDGREALAFAALGARFLVGEPSTSPSATGAQGGRILGKWTPSHV